MCCLYLYWRYVLYLRRGLRSSPAMTELKTRAARAAVLRWNAMWNMLKTTIRTTKKAVIRRNLLLRFQRRWKTRGFFWRRERQRRRNLTPAKTPFAPPSKRLFPRLSRIIRLRLSPRTFSSLKTITRCALPTIWAGRTESRSNIKLITRIPRVITNIRRVVLFLMTAMSIPGARRTGRCAWAARICSIGRRPSIWKKTKYSARRTVSAIFTITR